MKLYEVTKIYHLHFPEFATEDDSASFTIAEIEEKNEKFIASLEPGCLIPTVGYNIFYARYGWGYAVGDYLPGRNCYLGKTLKEACDKLKEKYIQKV